MSKEISAGDAAVVNKEIEGLANRLAQETANVFSGERTLAAVASHMSKVDREVDAAIARYQAMRYEGGEIACKKGCAWCCQEIVVASVPEILGLYQHVESTFSDADKTALRARLKTYEEAMVGNRDHTFTLARAACPFLVDNACSVYEARPLECRGKSSENANACRMLTLSPGDGDFVPSFSVQKVTARAAARGLSYGFMTQGTSLVHELGRCMALLFENPSLADDVLSGRSTFPSVFPGIKPIVFPADGTSVWPPLIEDTNFKKAIALADISDYRSAKSCVDPHSPYGLFVKMRAPDAYGSIEDIEEYRSRLSEALDELEESKYPPKELLVPLGEYSMATLPYQGLPVRDLLERQGRIFHDKIVSKVYPHLCAPIVTPRRPGPFRLGYISAALMLTNGSSWALGWLRNHRPDIDTYALNLGTEDIVSKIWAQFAKHYFALHGNVQRIAEFIRGLDLDALIITEVGFRRRDFIYFSMRLARVQCTAWGVPCTSGLPNLDYYLSSDYMEPEGAEAEYTEKLVRLPHSGLCYPRPKTMFWEGEFQREATEFFPFMAQNLRKWTPQKDYLLKRVQDRAGKPLKMIAASSPESTEIISRRFVRLGIEHEIMPFTRREGFARRLASADVSFDPPDWSGGNTTIEALTYGVPVVTLPGTYMRGRHSLAFLRMANLDGLIAKDEDEFVDLIFDKERQQEAMRHIDLDALYEDKVVVEALDRVLFEASPDFR